MPIQLVAVVLGRVVAGRDHDAGIGRERPYRVSDEGRGHRVQKAFHGNADREQHARRGIGEPLAIESRVATDHHGQRARIARAAHELVGQGASDANHDRQIHARTARSDDAAQASGTEFEIGEHAFDELVVLARVNQR